MVGCLLLQIRYCFRVAAAPPTPAKRGSGVPVPLARRSSSWLLLVTFSELALAWLAFVCDVALAWGVHSALVTPRPGHSRAGFRLRTNRRQCASQCDDGLGGGLLLER